MEDGALGHFETRSPEMCKIILLLADWGQKLETPQGSLRFFVFLLVFEGQMVILGMIPGSLLFFSPEGLRRPCSTRDDAEHMLNPFIPSPTWDLPVTGWSGWSRACPAAFIVLGILC